MAYGSQVAFVDLSHQHEASLSSGPHEGHGRGGRAYDGPPQKAYVEPIRLVLTRVIATKEGSLARYVVEAVMTNTGDTPISIPVGTDDGSLLSPAWHDRHALAFSVTLGTGKEARPVGAAGVSASNREHPESAVSLRPGDAAVFLLPVGSWMPGKVPTRKSVCMSGDYAKSSTAA